MVMHSLFLYFLFIAELCSVRPLLGLAQDTSPNCALLRRNRLPYFPSRLDSWWDYGATSSHLAAPALTALIWRGHGRGLALSHLFSCPALTPDFWGGL